MVCHTPCTEYGSVRVKASMAARSFASTTNRLPTGVSPSSATSGPALTICTPYFPDSSRWMRCARQCLARVSMMPGLSIASVMVLAPGRGLAQAPKVGEPTEAKNMRLVGYSDLQERSAYQPTIHKQGSRYSAYVGHHGGTPDIPKPTNKLTGQAEF